MHRQLIDAQQENMDDAPDLSTMIRRFKATLKTRTQDAVKALDTRQKVLEQSILHLQSQVHNQERLLQERIKLHEQRVLKAETTLSEWETMLTAHEERLEVKEAEMRERLAAKEAEMREWLRQTEENLTQRIREVGEILEARQSERILEDGSEWEDHINTKTEEYVTSLIEQLQEKDSIQLTSYKVSLDQLATQRELKTKAWMEVATTQTLDGLSDKLTAFKNEEQANIEDFFNVHQQNFQQDLDEFQCHAQETLHAGIFGPDHPNPRARYAPPPSRAIPVEINDPRPPVADNRAP